MFRCLIASLLLMAVAFTDATAQSKPNRARKKRVPYSVRAARRAPAAPINPHTGKPYGYGVSQDIKDGSGYLAPGVPMRKQVGYTGNGGYNDNRPHRPGIKKQANSSLNRDGGVPVIPAKGKTSRR